jgi:preprotein translocase subunit SecG
MLIYYAVVAVHVIVCVILVLVVLLQSGKGADLAGAFGGGATQTAFGSRGPASFLSKMTTVAAIVFMVTSIALSMIPHAGTKKGSESMMKKEGTQSTQPGKPAPVSQPALPVPPPDQIRKQVEEEEQKQKAASAPNQQKPQDSKSATPQPPGEKK